MRKMTRPAIAFGFALAVVAGPVAAKENIIRFFERNNEQFVTQAEWAVTLVNAMGSGDDMDADAPVVDFIALLEKNRIQPIEGWNGGEFLTYGAKAVTMVQALGLEDQVPPDAKEMDYVWLLESLGFHEGHPTELVPKTDALLRNVNDPIYQEVAGNEFNINITPFAPDTSGQ